MAYDQGLAERVRRSLQGTMVFHEKKMFGGICFLINGNMVCGILKNNLIVRVGVEKYEDFLAQPHVSKFDITGEPMKGWVIGQCLCSLYLPSLAIRFHTISDT